MGIIRQTTELGNEVVIGTGRVLCAKGENPVSMGYFYTKNGLQLKRANFALTTDSKKSSKTDEIYYENIQLLVLNEGYNKEIWTIVQSLKRGESVFFVASKSINKIKSVDGTEQWTNVYRPTVLIPVTRALRFFINSGIPDIAGKIETIQAKSSKTKNNDMPF